MAKKSCLIQIYGYETRYFNRQVINNIEKFPSDFMFRLTKEETENLMCKKFTSSWGGARTLPYAFTEQGIYMLMTILKGELATKQSILIIRVFKSMKDYIVADHGLLSAKDIVLLPKKVDQNAKKIKEISRKLEEVMDNFVDPSLRKHFLIMNGERIESDVAYQSIYSMAKRSILLIDNYIDVKTLQLLKSSRKGLEIIIFSDNKARNSLNMDFITDFRKDRPDIDLSFKEACKKFHDRYVILDFGEVDETFYHCGVSSKDSGACITSIIKIENPFVYHPIIDEAMNNNPLLFS